MFEIPSAFALRISTSLPVRIIMLSCKLRQPPSGSEKLVCCCQLSGQTPSQCQASAKQKRNAFPLPASPAISTRKSRGWITNHHISHHGQSCDAGELASVSLSSKYPYLSTPSSIHQQAISALPESSLKWHGYARNIPSAKKSSTLPILSALSSNISAVADLVSPTPTTKNSREFPGNRSYYTNRTNRGPRHIIMKNRNIITSQIITSKKRSITQG